MGSRTLLILLVLVAALAAAIFLVDRQPGAGSDASVERLGQPLFPGLKDRLNDVTALTIGTSSAEIALQREGDTWRVKSKDGYPADFDAVRRTLIAVSDLVVLEAKTSRPELFPKLGVEDPAGAGAVSALVTLQGADGQPVASLVAGNPGPGRDTLYARRATENLSWLVRGPLELPREAVQWIDTTLPKLEANRVKDATVTHADGEVVTVARASVDDAVWAVVDMGEGMQPSSPTVGRVLAAALESVDFEDVRAAGTAPLSGENQAVTTFTTFDGLRLTATSAVSDGKTWVTLAASQVEPAPADAATKPDAGDGADNGPGDGEDAGDGAEDGAAPQAPAAPAAEGVSDDAAQAEAAAKSAAVAKEVEDLNARLTPWVFQLPDYRAGNLRKRKSDLVQPIPPPAEPAEPAPGIAVPGTDAPPAEAPPEEAPDPAAPPGSEPADDATPAEVPPAEEPR